MANGNSSKEDYGVKMDPTTIIVDKQGMIVSKTEGLIDPLEFKNNINFLMQNKQLINEE